MTCRVCRLAILWFLVPGPAVRAHPTGVDVTGTWDLSVDAGPSSGEAELLLKQDGQELSGTYRGRLGESRLAGAVTDHAIRFSVVLRFRDLSFTVVYSGQVEGDRMHGKVDFGDGRSGEWRARRRS